MTTTGANTGSRRQRTAAGVAITLLVGALAFWFSRPARDGGLLSDDLLAPALFLAESPEGSQGTDPQAARDVDWDVDWDEVERDFARPWLGLSAPLYRPMVSVSLALDFEEPDFRASLHRTNRVLHALVAALSVLLTLVMLSRRSLVGATVPALAVGLLTAVHPVAVECCSWIAARNSSQEVCFRMLALLGFALHLRAHRSLAIRTAALGTCAVATALALATKESAVVLAPLFVLFDLFVRGRPTRTDWRRRLRPYLVLGPVFVAYLGLRLALFGSDQTGAATESTDALEAFSQKLRGLFLAGQPMDSTAGGLLLAGFALCLLVGRPLRALGALSLILVVLWLPTLRQGVSEQLVGSRFLYGSVPLLGLALAIYAQRSGWTRLRSAVAGLATLVVVAVLWSVSGERFDDYRSAWNSERAVEAAIAELPDGPLAIAALPATPLELPPFNQNNWFLLFQPPLSDRRGPTFGLGHQIVPIPRSEDLLDDARIERVLLRSGVPVVNLVRAPDGSVVTQILDRDNRPPIPSPVALRFDDRGYAPADPSIHAFAFDLVRLRFDSALGAPGEPGIGRPRLRVLLPKVDAGVPHHLEFELRREPDDSFTADLRPSLWTTALGTYRLGVLGFEVVDLATGVQVLEGRLETMPTIEWAQVGAESPDGVPTVALAGLEIALPDSPEGLDWALHVLGPDTSFRMTGRSGERLRFDDDRNARLRLLLRLAATDVVGLQAETLTGPRLSTGLRYLSLRSERTR